MKLNDRDIELINLVKKDREFSKEDILSLSKKELLDLTELLGGLIGYDENGKDIDSIGLEADNVISKLLKILEQRGDI